jgi:NADH:ubiquinone reductase (H+-translocating)
MKRLLVAGGGIAGFNLIKSLLPHVSADNLHITLADPQHDFVFKPILYEQLNGRVVSVNRAAFFQHHSKQLTHLAQKVTTCDLQDNHVIKVSFDNGKTDDFDFVVLAIGAKTNYFGVPGAPEHCLSLLTQADMETFKQSLDKKLTAAVETQQKPVFDIIGAGLSGVELAFELRAYLDGDATRRYGQFPAPEIRMIEAMPTILPGFGEDEIQTVLSRLEDHQVRVFTGHQVKQVTADVITVKHGDTVKELQTEDPLWVAGIQANLPEGFFAQAVEQYPGNGRIKLTGQLSIPNHPNLFVVGDLAGCENPKTGRLIPTTGQLGEQQAVYVAKLLRRRIRKGHLVANYPVFEPEVRGHFVSLGPGQAAMTLDGAPGPLAGKTLVGGFISKVRQRYYATKMTV